MRLGLAVLMALILPICVQAQNSNHRYASDSEINLLITQASRAMDQYRELVDQEKKIFGDSADVAIDLKILRAWDTTKVVLTKNPQQFNSVLGYDTVVLLDDAARNAALAASGASLEALKEITGGKVTPQTDMLVTLFQNATATGTLLYTISESASAMYRGFATWQEDTLNASVALVQKCGELAKKSSER